MSILKFNKKEEKISPSNDQEQEFIDSLSNIKIVMDINMENR